MSSSPVRLITIPISHYCEKVRWALQWHQIPYVEEPHMPPFHRLATGKVGGGSAPVLITPTQTLTDSTDILRYLDTIAPPDRALYPTNPDALQEIHALEHLLNRQLGEAARQWGYFWGLDQRQRLKLAWTAGVPWYEALWFPVILPVVRSKVQQLYDITPESATQAAQTLNQIFEEVSQRLADGRAYLMGDRLSAADITFASLAAPVIRPPGYPFEDYAQSKRWSEPAEQLAQIQTWQKTRAGQFVQQLWRERKFD